ncbi:MAG: 5'/3'-nucleotidase SurE [Verrucomicrobiota bacterium]
MIALLTNDDGIDAEGLRALKDVAEFSFDECWVVAPAEQMSQIGHRVTTDEPLRFEKRGEREFALHGTPADCARVAMAYLMPKKPDWILSGINHGGNLGRHDFVISGTVAAVREAAFAGIPGVAFSHFMKRGLSLDWEQAAQRSWRAFEQIREYEMSHGEFWTVNLPHLEEGDPEPKVVFCEQETHPLLVQFEQVGTDEVIYVGDYHERPRSPGSDVSVCFGGDIAVSKAGI